MTEFSTRPSQDKDIAARTDVYFNRTKAIVERFGDVAVSYAIFLRRPVISAPGIMLAWLEEVARGRGVALEIEVMHVEGAWVGAGEPLVYISGSFAALVDLETLLLQKIGPACVAAHNAYQMAMALPKVSFLAMDARHCAGADMLAPWGAGRRRRRGQPVLSATPMMRPRIILAWRMGLAPCRMR